METAKKPKLDEKDIDLNGSNTLVKSEDKILTSFIKWMKEGGFEISSKLEITKENSCARYGMLAKDDIKCEEVIFSVPRSGLLWEGNCKITKALKDAKITTKGSGWAKLLLCLMLEYTSNESKWRPYMDFVPPVNCMDQPMFWNTDQLEWLKGTGTYEAVMRDICSIELEYNEIALPFIKQNEGIGFDAKVHNLQLWKYMVAFVMAYSFTEPMKSENDNTSPKMVPLADVLNHVANNNAQLEFEEDCLQMIATKNIKKGEEIYNTYGQLPNCKLLQMYGFVEKDSCNVYDTVDIPVSTIYEIAGNDENNNCFPCLEDKKEYLLETMDIEPEDVLTFNENGVLSSTLFKDLSKVLPMTEKEFSDFQENEDSDSENSDDSNLSDSEMFVTFQFKTITKMPKSVRKLFNAAAVQTYKNYFNFKNEKCPNSELIESRYTRAKQLVHGQLRLLDLLKTATQ